MTKICAGLLLCLLCVPGFGQTWQKAVTKMTLESAKKIPQKGFLESTATSWQQLLRTQSVTGALSARHQNLPMYNQMRKEHPLLPKAISSGLSPISIQLTREHNAWVDQNNKNLLSESIVLEHRFRQLQKNLPEVLEKMQFSTEFTPPVIDARVKYLFLGEVHRVALAQEIMRRTIVSARAQYPNRQIILLTEFGFDSFPRFVEDFSTEVFPQYSQMFQDVKALDIPIIGLEERIVHEGEHSYLVKYTEPGAGQTTEGIRLRNLHWYTRIKQWREKYPDALFIIYGGAGHMEYNREFSLPASFAAGETFVLSIGAVSVELTPFHLLTRGKFLKRGNVISWRDPRLARLAGFDMSVVVSLD